MVDMVMDIIISFLMGFTSGILLVHILVVIDEKETYKIEDEEKEDEGE